MSANNLLIYELISQNEKIDIDVKFDTYPNPKLLKYGYNSSIDLLNTNFLNTDDHYKVVLNFDLDRTDKDSLKVQAEKFFDTTLEKNFYEFWEIIILFKLLQSDQVIDTNNQSVMTQIINILNKIFKNKHKLNLNKGNNSLIFFKYSDIDLDENILTQLLCKNLPDMLDNLIVNGNLIVQIFDMQTNIMIQLINYLCTLFKEIYIYKPFITSEISNAKYLILLGYRTKISLIIPRRESEYINSIYDQPINNIISTKIISINSYLQPLKLYTLATIKEYLDIKVLEGATYNSYLNRQNINVIKWLEYFTTLNNIDKLFKDSLDFHK